MQTKTQKYWLFFSNNIYLSKCPKAWWEKKWRGRANFGRIKFSSSLFASKMSATYKPVTLNCFCWRHIINILLTALSRSVWENLDLGRVYRPHCVRSVLTTSVKILPYRPPARLIRAKYMCAKRVLWNKASKGITRTSPQKNKTRRRKVNSERSRGSG